LRVACIKVVVKGKGGDESAERGSVHDEKQRSENGALGNKDEKVLLHLTQKERDGRT